MFIDEFFVTNRTELKVEFSNLRKNVTVVPQKMIIKPLSVIIAVSRENGKEALRYFTGSINYDKFVKILDDILKNGKKVHLLADNVSYHKGKKT